MYGLLLENLSDFIKTKYGEEKWEEVRRQAGVEQPSFSTHQVYPDCHIPRLAHAAFEVLDISEQEFFDQMGVHFVGYVSQYGYDRVLSVLGRHMRDFLNGLDNLHEYLKFSYPRMRAPSFICENETRQGLTLHYRSKRRGFVYYAMGQIREVARHFYNKDMRIELVREELLLETVHVTFQLTFDNRAFTLASLTMTREEKHLPISASVLFEIFPFCIVFSSDMIVRSIGNSLMVILPDLVGKKLTNWFDLVRPLIPFKFQTILNRTNNIFELVTVEPVFTERQSAKRNNMLVLSDEIESDLDEKKLRLKGQMIYMDNWRMMMYLGTPVMPDLRALITTGLYINDLSMHDFSRDLMLAGTQQSVELKLALDQEQLKSKKLEESMRKLDEEMKRTDELLYQMIPKQVADRLRTGENPIDTCQMFDSVSILFSDVVTFTEICSRITPMEVVSMLNAMYSIFDTLTERNRVYKVETIGDAYMVVSGAPEQEHNHAEKVCDMALDMVDAITDLKDPSTGAHLQIRVGIHSGAVVAGIVGLKMPRYCLFGDTVNTASRMESTSEPMKIHISQNTKELIAAEYKVSQRGEILIKGKGSMKTYWLEQHELRAPLSRVTQPPASYPELEWEKLTDNLKDLVEERRVYSPVLFHHSGGAAARSFSSSPVRTYPDLRENITGSVHSIHSRPRASTPLPIKNNKLKSDQHMISSLESRLSLLETYTHQYVERKRSVSNASEIMRKKFLFRRCSTNSTEDNTGESSCSLPKTACVNKPHSKIEDQNIPKITVLARDKQETTRYLTEIEIPCLCRSTGKRSSTSESSLGLMGDEKINPECDDTCSSVESYKQNIKCSVSFDIPKSYDRTTSDEKSSSESNRNLDEYHTDELFVKSNNEIAKNNIIEEKDEIIFISKYDKTTPFKYKETQPRDYCEEIVKVYSSPKHMAKLTLPKHMNSTLSNTEDAENDRHEQEKRPLEVNLSNSSSIKGQCCSVLKVPPPSKTSSMSKSFGMKKSHSSPSCCVQ